MRPMETLKATAVFTPNSSSPKLSLVQRTEIEHEIDDYLEEGGKFVCLQGVTKLGKTTIADTAAKKIDLTFKFDSQNLQGGAKDLWRALASKLRQPVEEAHSRGTTDTAKWSFRGLLGFFNAEAAGDHAKTSGKTVTFENDLAQIVTSAIEGLTAEGKTILVVLDDFHFIENQSARVEILQALKPIANHKVSVLLVTLPERDFSRIFNKANLMGRSATVQVPLWSTDELEGIAVKGFKELNVQADPETIKMLAKKSYGSPQIMQTLSLRLCRNANNVRDKQEHLTPLLPPSEPKKFYSAAIDDSSKKWLAKLASGKGTRGTERNVYTDPASKRKYDGYTICLQALKNIGPKPVTTFEELKFEVARVLGIEPKDVSRMQLHGPLSNMTDIAHEEMKATLATVVPEGLPLSISIPQPFFEWGQTEMEQPIKILDPVLLFAIDWHWEEIMSSIERRQTLASLESS